MYTTTRLLRSLLLLSATLLLLGTLPLLSQQTTSVIRGQWSAPGDDKTLIVRLYEVTTDALLQEKILQSDGSFSFYDVPVGSYRIDLFEDETPLAGTLVQVTSAVPVTVSLVDDGGESVVITAQRMAERNKTTSSTVFTAPFIASIPTATPEKRIESVLLNTPGVVPDEDGRFHIRGEDAQLQYVIDGIPVTANMTRIYGSLFDASLVNSMEIQTGSLDAEYGTAAAGVLVINTKSGFDAPSFARASISRSSFDGFSSSAQAGGNFNGNLAGFFAVSTSESSRYLDPISGFEPLHDRGSTNHLFGKGDWIVNESFSVGALASVNSTNFEIPNGRVKEPAQNQRQEQDDQLVGVRGTAILSEEGVLGIVGYWRHATIEERSGGLMQIVSPADSLLAIAQNEKFFIGARRENTAYGGQLDYSFATDWFGAQNHLKVGAGAEMYPLDEFFTFAVTNPALSNPDTAGGDARLIPYDLTKGGSPLVVDRAETGNRISAYAQDRIEFGKWTVNAGVRFDRFSLLEDEIAISPRLAAAYAISDNVTLRASYNRVVMQAPVENVLVSSSVEARTLAGQEQGGTPTSVRSEKAHVAELGASFVLSDRFVLRTAAYGKMMEDFLVKAELGNSGIIFPLNLKTGLVAGGEIVASMREWHHLSALLTVSGGIAFGLTPEDGSSPIAAGLIIGEEGYFYSHPFSEEEHFPTEHSQIVAASLNLRYGLPAGFFATLQGRFDSGLPFDLTDANGNGLDPEASRVELRHRGYSDDVIDMLNLESERPGSPDKSVAPHGTIDLAVGIDLDRYIGSHARVTAMMTNVFDTPYLYKFESSFGGTHFGQPRMLAAMLELGL